MIDWVDGLSGQWRTGFAIAAATAALIGIGLPSLAQEEFDPLAPRNLSARLVEDGVALNWLPPEEDAASVEGYEIMRRRPNRGEGVLQTLKSDTGNTDTAYLDLTATEPGVRYTYRVKAIRSGQRSAWSKHAMVMLPPYRLVSNLGQPSESTASISQQYAMGFRLGTHGQGYEINSVLIELASVPSSLTVSLWISSVLGDERVTNAQRKLFDFTNPGSFAVGLNLFTAPPGAFAYQNMNYFIVLSGFGSSMSIKETSWDAEDHGGEPGAVLRNIACTRSRGSTGHWTGCTARGNVLRLAVEGSKRDRGIIGANYTSFVLEDSDDTLSRETLSVGDTCCFELTFGAADRYLIRGLSALGDDTAGHGWFGLPFELHDSTGKLFSFAFASASGDLVSGHHSLTNPAGLSEWTVPQGATVAGGSSYPLKMTIQGIPGDDFQVDSMGNDTEEYATRGGVFLTQIYCSDSTALDTPGPAGVAFASIGDVACVGPPIAVLGEPLHGMVSNLGQTANDYIWLGDSGGHTPVVAQTFLTGSNPDDYRLQGIGIQVDGSDDGNGTLQIPAGPSSVSVAVHAASTASVGAKLFDLVSPDEYTQGDVSFFEAPAGTVLEPDSFYDVVWTYHSGTWHRLSRTTSNTPDSGSLAHFGIDGAYYAGADLNNLTVDSGGNALQIAVYGEPVVREYHVTPNWPRIPEGIELGDKFRLLFVTTSRTDATHIPIAAYNTVVQEEASREYNERIIRGAAPDFKAVACTGKVNARPNTGMTDPQGVPVHWMDGGWDDYPTLIADRYDQFYSADWENREWGAYSTGNSMRMYRGRQIWTGCNAEGVGVLPSFLGSVSFAGVVSVGTPGDTSTNLAPLGPIDSLLDDFPSAEIDTELQLYGISPIFTVIPGG